MNTEAVKQEPAARELGHVPGRWVTPEVNYVDPARHFCAFCGRPIARRFWQVGEEEGAVLYCDPAHASRDTTYPRR